jgi:hypothetical protein
MTSSVFVSSPAGLSGTADSFAEGLVLRSPISDALFRRTFETSGVEDFCIVSDGGLLETVGVDVTGVFSLLTVAGVVTPRDEVPVVGKACGLAGSGSFLPSEVTGGSGFFCASLFRILLSVICSRAETGGRLIKVDGKRVTSFFISESNSSNWLRTKTIIFKISILRQINRNISKREGEAEIFISYFMVLEVLLHKTIKIFYVINFSDSCHIHQPLCKTAFAGLFPFNDSFERC